MRRLDPLMDPRAAIWMLGIAATITLAVSGCQSFAVYTDFDSSIRYDDLRSFAWLEPPEVEGANPFADNSLLRKRLRGAIETTLQERGYRAVESGEEADFLATYSVVLEERIRDDGSVNVGFGGYRRYGYGTIYSAPTVRNYQESTLIIDIVQPANQDLIWRGWGSGVVGTRDRERSDERILAGVRRILQKFPPDVAQENSL